MNHNKIEDKHDVDLSKRLSWLLRHGAVKEGIHMKSDGYILVKDLLKHSSLKEKYNLADVERVVNSNKKQRFSLKGVGDFLEICANQGHTIGGLEDLNLKPITKPITNVIHGTYFRNWENIRTTGINRMRRNHIHFASGLPNDSQVISGIRPDADVFIYINLKAALADDLKFYESVNRVILSTGDENGTVLPKYFLKAVDRSGKNLLQK